MAFVIQPLPPPQATVETHYQFFPRSADLARTLRQRDLLRLSHGYFLSATHLRNRARRPACSHREYRDRSIGQQWLAGGKS